MKTTQNQPLSKNGELKFPPDNCPQCGHHDFIELKPERGGFFSLMCVVSFIFDLFATRPVTSVGLETLNKRRPGWMCKKCGWEVRQK